MSIYVGNLPNEVTEGGLKSVFAEYVTVNWVKLPIDRETSRLWGVGFIEKGTESVGIDIDLDGDELVGRVLEVIKAKPHAERCKISGSLGNKSGGNAWRY